MQSVTHALKPLMPGAEVLTPPVQGYVNNLALDLGTLQSRYSALNQQLAPSVHRYNTYWNSFEASGQPASDQPLDCPSDYTLVPADPSGLVANGGTYNQFRWSAVQPVLAGSGHRLTESWQECSLCCLVIASPGWRLELQLNTCLPALHADSGEGCAGLVTWGATGDTSLEVTRSHGVDGCRQLGT